MERHWFDDDHAIFARSLEEKLGEHDNWRLVETSLDLKTWLIYVSSAKDPGTYMVWDSQTKTLSTVGKDRPGLSQDVLSTRTRVDYQANDGLALSGYFTPSLKEAESSPLVVIPHGGPVARDHLDWDGWAQFLAFRGFNVFQPNFRGSGGFGLEFEELGHLEWGKKMRSDIEDGVLHLETLNLIPAFSKRAMVGASYGGYAALIAAVKTPTRYQCIMSINGVTDPISFMESYDETDPLQNYVKDIWIKRIGDPDTNLDALKDISPLHNVDEIHAEVFLSHGTADKVVPVSQSQTFYKAAKQAGANISYKSMPGVRHSGWGDTLNTQILSDINIFLLRCM